MTIDEQIELVEKHEDLPEVLLTLNQLKKILNETDQDMRKHRYHFLRQRLLDIKIPAQSDYAKHRIEQEEEVDISMEIGEVFYFCGRKLRYLKKKGIDLIAMDTNKKEVQIPKIRWKEIQIPN